ncbi:MAG TPA: response regulator [Candidatus Sulfotelmatobacter sp.]|jgi:CheY-like chemotaxis protein|nr:response regulator [Candidatus Sulfotelmatobacter sp.]
MMSALDGVELKVLVVEDNQHFRLLISTVLHTLGITQVEEARDGVDALRRLHSFPADFVIVDWKMEPMDGIGFAHAIRHSPESPNPFLPIIMVTGYSEAALVAEARNAGVNEFLAKPISARSLVARITSVLQTPRAFVRSPDYFGPDRRRGQQPFSGPDRRVGPADIILPVKPDACQE